MRVRSAFQRKQRSSSPLLGAADADKKETTSIALGGVLLTVKEGASSDKVQRSGGVHRGGSLDGDKKTWASANFSMTGHSTAANEQLSNNFGAAFNNEEALSIRWCAKCDSNYKLPHKNHDWHTGECAGEARSLLPVRVHCDRRAQSKALHSDAAVHLSTLAVVFCFDNETVGAVWQQPEGVQRGGEEYINNNAGGVLSECGRSAGIFAGTLGRILKCERFGCSKQRQDVHIHHIHLLH